MMKRGKSLSRFLSRSIIIGEMLERKMRTDEIEKRGNEILSGIDHLSINENFTSTLSFQENSAKKEQKKQNVQTTQNIENAQTERKEPPKEIVDKITHSTESENKIAESSVEVIEDKDSIDASLDDDIFKKAMKFMGGF